MASKLNGTCFCMVRRLRRSSNEFFESRDRHRQLSEAVIKIDNQIPIFVLKKILEWERDADKDENRLGSDRDADGDADKDENRLGSDGDADGDADKDENRLGSDGDADGDENRLGSDGDADADADKDENRGCRWGCMQIKMKTGEGDADTDLHSILKHAWLKLSPILYDDSHVIAEVQLKDDSHLLEFLYENIIGSSDVKYHWLWLSTMHEPNHWDSCLMYRAGISDRPGMPIHTPIPSQSHVPILPFHHNRHQNVHTYDVDGQPLRCVLYRLNLLKAR